MYPIDLSTPIGAAAVLAFLLLVVASYGSRWRGTTVSLALVGTGLTIIGYWGSALSGPLIVDFGLQLALLWTATFLILAYRRSRTRLQDREARLRAVINTAVDGVIIIDVGQGKWNDTGIKDDFLIISINKHPVKDVNDLRNLLPGRI